YTVSAYTTPAYAYPALLVSGGTQDVWPSPQFALIDFVAGTDTLESNLVADGHVVVRCRHNQGHTITQDEYAFAVEWVTSHRFGDASIYAEGDLSGNEDWCELASQ
ncbi:MAG: hypothetical protein H6741_24670, partial [Alphaproteobacteria bacterium]|nr:hypothetical protein [Alphaproteobacteria bacterium]